MKFDGKDNLFVITT